MEFNVYNNPRSTEHTRHRERRNTRVYIALLIGSTIVIVFYAELIQHWENRIVSSLSQSIYNELLSNYSASLQCPCSTVSIVQQNFISHLNASLHPVCSSALARKEWSTYLTGNPRLPASSFLRKTDFRQMGSSSVSNSPISLFDGQRDPDDCHCTIQSASIHLQSTSTSITVSSGKRCKRMQQFQSATAAIFRSLVGPIRAAAQGNALMTVLGTNWIPKLDYFAIGVSLLTVPVVYGENNCSCATSSTCSEPAVFFNSTWGPPYYTVSDVFLGCTPLDSLLMSSVSCFFSAACLDSFLNAITYSQVLVLSIAHNRIQWPRWVSHRTAHAFQAEWHFWNHHQCSFHRFLVECRFPIRITSMLVNLCTALT